MRCRLLLSQGAFARRCAFQQLAPSRAGKPVVQLVALARSQDRRTAPPAATPPACRILCLVGMQHVHSACGLVDDRSLSLASETTSGTRHIGLHMLHADAKQGRGG